MSTIAFICGCVLLCLVVMSKIPGLEHLVKPCIDLIFTGIKVGGANGSYWLVWLFKLLLSSHLDFARHLIFSAEAIDPSLEIRNKEA